MTIQHRVPAGRPAGGQYAATEHPEPEVALTADHSPLQETQRGRRGHDFYPKPDEMADWPALYATDGVPLPEKPLVAHYFQGSIDFYVAEFDPASAEAFGWADLGQGGGEWGYFPLDEIEQLRGQFGLPIERDLDFKPGTTAKECIPKYRDQG